MIAPLMDHHEPKDLTGDLARTLPRWVGWIPVVGKASYRWWINRQAQRRPQNNVNVDLLSARIALHARDEASIELMFALANFGTVAVEVDRVELHSLTVGTRMLQRRSDMLKMSGIVGARSANRVALVVDLHGSDIRNVVQGVGKSVNLWSGPHVSVDVYAEIVFICGKDRFKKVLQHGTSVVNAHISAAVAEALADADGITVF